MPTLCQANLANLLEPIFAKAEEQKPVLVSVDGVTKKMEKSKMPISMGPMSASLSNAEIMSAIRSAVVDKFNIKGDLRIYLLSVVPAIKVNHNDWQLIVTEYPASGIDNNFLIKFKIVSSGEEKGEWSMPVRCELWRSAYVTARPVAQGEALSKDLFDTQLLNVLKANQGLVLADEVNLDGLETKKSLQADTPLFYRDVREQPSVRKGQIVDVVARDGLLNITMKGLAMEDGAKQDFILVRNMESNKKFQAQIVDENVVQIYF